MKTQIPQLGAKFRGRGKPWALLISQCAGGHRLQHVGGT